MQDLCSNIADYCRLCLTQEGLSGLNHGFPPDDFMQQVQDCFDIQMSPDNRLSGLICSECKEQVKSICLFKSKCLNSKSLVEVGGRWRAEELLVELNVIMDDMVVDRLGTRQCHLCLDDEVVQSENGSFFLKLEACFGIQMPSLREKTPSSFCNRCYNQILSAISFKEQCVTSESFLEQIYKPSLLDDTFSNSITELTTDELISNGLDCLEDEHASLDLEPCEPCGSPSSRDAFPDLSLKIAEFEEDLFCRADMERYQCDICLKDYSSRKKLKRHMEVHSLIRKYVCSICFKDFYLKNRLEAHERTHSGEKPFGCKQCGKMFRQLAALRRHESSHLEDRPYKCPLCSKTFKYKEFLTAHMHTHSGQNLYTCKVCNKAFRHRCGLYKHLKTHTGDKNYTCVQCKKSFIRSDALAQHMKIHSTEKPHTCQVCGNSFNIKSSLIAHLRKHSEVKSFHCNYCTKSFKQPGSLSKHLRKHTTPKMLQKPTVQELKQPREACKDCLFYPCLCIKSYFPDNSKCFKNVITIKTE